MNESALSEPILILGASGMLGSSLTPYLLSRGYPIRGHSMSSDAFDQADLVDEAEAAKFMDRIKPSVIINLVGLTDVDRCEINPDDAYRVNVKSVENIAHWIKHQRPNCHLIHISTDQVYDGWPIHRESDVRIVNCYAFSKYAGELAAKGVAATIVRTNFFGLSLNSKRKSLTDWLFNALNQNNSVPVFEDVFFSPISMSSLCEIIELLALKKPVGVFNVGSREGMSKADFAFAFAKALNISSENMRRIKIDEIDFLKAKRPKSMCMDYTYINQKMGIFMPLLQNEIELVARAYL